VDAVEKSIPIPRATRDTPLSFSIRVVATRSEGLSGPSGHGRPEHQTAAATGEGLFLLLADDSAGRKLSLIRVKSGANR
jgi:hypothetical protein